MTLHLAAESWL